MTDPQMPSGAQPNQPQYGQQHAGAPQYGQQPQYGQPQAAGPQYGQGPVPPQYSQPYVQGPQKPPGKAPTVLIVLGAILLAVSVGCGILFATQVGSLIPSASSTVIVDGATEVNVTGDEMKVIFSSDPNVSCNVTGPGESEPDVWLDQSMKFSTNGVSFEAIGKIGGPGEESGTYLIECDGPGVVIAPPLSVGGIVSVVIVAVVSALSGVTGLILLIVGLVLRSSRRKRARA